MRGYIFLQKKYEWHTKEKPRKGRTRACAFEAAVGLLNLLKHTKFNKQGPDIMCQCDVYYRGPVWLRNDSGLPVTERRSPTKCVLHSTPFEKVWKRNAPHIRQLCWGLPPIILPQSCWKNTKVSDRAERLMLPRNVWQRTGRLWKERSAWTCLPSLSVWKRGSGKQMPLDWKQLLSWRNMVLNRAVCAKMSKNVTC